MVTSTPDDNNEHQDPADAGSDAFDYAAPDTPADRAGDFADELDGLRIRQLSALRRGAYRARSYAIIGAAAGFVVAVQLVIMTVAYVRAHGWGRWPTGYVLFAAAAVMMGCFFARRALEIHREIRTPVELPPPPPGGPDFSTLSDGSQQWKNLEDIK